MPSLINGFHEDETVKPEKMGRENMDTLEGSRTRPSFIRQRSNVQKVDDVDELDGSIQTVCKHKHENSDTTTKCVKFKNDEYCAHGSDKDGIEMRPPENSDEECASLTDDKQNKRQRHEHKKCKRRWFIIGGCGGLIFLVAMAALGVALYTHLHPQQNPSDHHVTLMLYCYSCDLVKAEDIVTYEEKRKLCCVGKNAELKMAKDKISSVTTMQMLKEKEKVKFQEIEIDFERSDTESLRLIITEAGDDPFLHLTENDKTITIDEDGLYMMALTMTATTFNKYSNIAGKYYMFMSCLKFIKDGIDMDDECRTITVLSAMRLPFEIHKTKHLEKGTVLHITANDIELLDQKSNLSKLSIIQLHKSVHKVKP